MLEIENSPERVNTTFSMNKKIRDQFYHLLIDKYGCTRDHVGKSIDEAIDLWIEKNKKAIETIEIPANAI